MSRVLYDNDGHKVMLFTGFVEGDGVHSNQLLIEDHGQLALFDPGGELTYQPLHMEISKHYDLKQLEFVVASHQDPDIITSMERWLLYSHARVVISELWQRFLPHLIPSIRAHDYEDRIVPVPDRGAIIRLGGCHITALPAHFLHSVGNLHFYDETSKILFSGDVGASMDNPDDDQPVDDFDLHSDSMLDFHRRYMASNYVCRLWVNMVRKLDLEMIVPQHGRPFVGKEMIEKFLGWFEELECGIDRLTAKSYSIPRL
ncbi:MAG: MBL fold metallo-hydrolase [Thioalkalispiraceae bacterium]|jgi:flavorubredoxin